MALTKEVTKKPVTKIMDKMWNITVNLILNNDAVEVLNKDFSVRYRTGDVISTKEAEFIELMQASIDAYKSEQQIYNAPALDTAVTNISNGLEV